MQPIIKKITPNKYLFVLYLLLSSLSLSFSRTFSQTSLTITTLKDSVCIVGNSFAFNSLIVSNVSSKTVDCSLSIDLPNKFWQSILSSSNKLTIKAGQTVYFPIRLSAMVGKI